MDTSKKLNSLIMSVTTAGESDCTGPITIYHKKIDRYLFVLVEEYTGDWHHRIFICDEGFRYERRYILEPLIGMDNPRCVVSAQQSTAYKNVRRYEILSQKLEKLQVSFSRKREETG